MQIKTCTNLCDTRTSPQTLCIRRIRQFLLCKEIAVWNFCQIDGEIHQKIYLKKTLGDSAHSVYIAACTCIRS